MEVTSASPPPARPRRRNAAPRLRSVALLLVVALLIGPALAGAASGSPFPCDAARPNPGGWRTIPVGPWPSGSGAPTDYSVDLGDSTKMLATNGSSVVYSFDSGCTWHASLDLTQPNTDRLSLDARAVQIGDLGRGNALLLVDDRLPKRHPTLLVTRDGGKSWSNFSPTLSDVRGRAMSFAVSGGRYYVLVDQSIGVPGVASVSPPHALYYTDDPNSAWQQGAQKPDGTGVNVGPLPTQPLTGDGKGTIDALRASPEHAENLWLYGTAGLYQTRDGGKRASAVKTGLGAIDFVRERPLGGGIEETTAYSATDPVGARSTGGAFQSFAIPTIVESASWGMADGILAGPGGVFLEDAQANGTTIYQNISPEDGRQIFDVDGIAGGSGTILGRSSGGLERYQSAIPTGPQFPHTYLPPFPNFDVDQIHNPKLLAETDDVLLHPGQSKTVRYTLVLPPTPTPLDVYFLFDVSGSMQDAIDGVRVASYDIIKTLAEAGINVWFGVGVYRAYEAPPAYRRVLDLSPPGEPLHRVLNHLTADGGGDETQLAALYQTASGAGQHDPGAYIKPHQQADFRTGALPVIVHATDEEFTEGGVNPGYQKVAAALNARGIKQIGLDLHDPEDPGPLDNVFPPNGTAQANSDPGPGLRRIAAATDTLAPPGGVDCNNDGIPDLEYQQPLVCLIDPDQAGEGDVMGNAILGTLRSFSDEGLVGLAATGSPVVKATIDPAQSVKLDFTQRHVQTYAVTYKCIHPKTTARHPIHVAALRAAGVLADATTNVTCKVPGVPAPHKEPPAPPVVPFFAPLAPVVPVPPRPPDVASNPNPNPQPNPQAQAQAQGALAAQEEEQPQLAYANNGARKVDPEPAGDEADRFHFTRYRQAPSQSPLDPIFVLVAAALTCAAGAALVRQRVQSRFAYARPRNQRVRGYGRRR